MRRTHDKFYLSENREVPVKDSFKAIANAISRETNEVTDGIEIFDIGCAVGVFPEYLVQRFPNATVTGCEFDRELLAAARKNFPDIPFIDFDVMARNSAVENSMDVATVCGVLSIFDDPTPAITNLVHWVRPGGFVFILNMFNPYDLDVYVKYKHAHEPVDSPLESGWNIISEATITRHLRTLGISDFTFEPFEISVDLAPKPDDQVRSWTEVTATGSRSIINGLNLRQPIQLLTIQL